MSNKESSITSVFNEYFNKRKELEEYEKSLRHREERLSEMEMNVSKLDNEINQKIALYENNQAAIKRYSYEASKVVKVNVGGTVLFTTIETLSKSPCLKALFAGQLDHKDGIFLDRDPETFKKLLSYLRTDYIELPFSHALEIEFKYFELEIPKKKYQSKSSDLDSDSNSESDSGPEDKRPKKIFKGKGRK